MLKSAEYLDFKKNLNAGNVCVFETDTVVGIGCIAEFSNSQNINKIYKIKHRSKIKALPWLVSSKKMLENYVDKIPDVAKKYFNDKYLGKTTLIFKVNSKVNKMFGSQTEEGLHTVAFRIPKCNELIKVIDEINCPIACTSANISSEDPVQRINDVNKEILNRVDFVYEKTLNGSTACKASTVISFLDGKEKIIRA